MRRLNETNELLALATALVNLKHIDKLIKSFSTGIEKIYSKYEFKWTTQATNVDIEVVVQNKVIGGFAVNRKFFRQKQSVENLNLIISQFSNLYENVYAHENKAKGSRELSVVVQKQMEALKQSESQLKSLLDNNKQAFTLLNREGVIVTYNHIAEKYFKLHFSTILKKGKKITELIPDGDLKERFQINFTKAVLGEFVEVDTPDTLFGEEHWYKFQYYPATVNDGEVQTVCISSVDITKLKQSEKELLDAKKKAEESDRLKTAFLANMSHELRTPMNGIIGFADMLVREDTPSDKRQYYSKIIINSCQQLLTIVNDIMDISKIETGKVELKKEIIVLNDIIQNILTLYKGKIQDTPLELIAETGLTNEQSVIESDKKKLSQILSNLVNNAIKFTKEGHVKIGYQKVEEYLHFYVEDTGIGIPKHLHEKIFERFRQGEVETTRKYGGTGLGLSISQKLAEILGGKIWLESEPDKGSIFYFSIPYKQIDLAALKNKGSNEGKSDTGKKPQEIVILIAEDEDTNYLYLEEIFSDYDYTLIRALNGLDAVNLCKQRNDISLVLMDIKMPKMSGLEATRIIKELRPELPIIAQTAFAMESDKQKAIAVGCDGYITKPIIQYNLINTVKKYI